VLLQDASEHLLHSAAPVIASPAEMVNGLPFIVQRTFNCPLGPHLPICRPLLLSVLRGFETRWADLVGGKGTASNAERFESRVGSLSVYWQSAQKRSTSTMTAAPVYIDEGKKVGGRVGEGRKRAKRFNASAEKCDSEVKCNLITCQHVRHNRSNASRHGYRCLDV
jgi:hypothetical protein